MSAIIGVILVATLLIPIVSTSASSVGDEVEYKNGETSAYHLMDGESLEFSRTNGDEGAFVTFNGTTYNQNTDIGAFGNLIMSDNVTITQNSAGNQCNVLVKGQTGNLFSGSASFSLVAADGTITITVNDTTYTYTYSWLAYYDPQGEYSLIRGEVSPIYVNSIDDYSASGMYTTGENDTYYFAHNGIVSGVTGYEASLDYTLTPVEGTTDVYTLTASIVIGDESFVPFMVLVPLTVTGHESGGTIYSLLSILPVLVVVGLIVGVVAVLGRRAELF